MEVIFGALIHQSPCTINGLKVGVFAFCFFSVSSSFQNVSFSTLLPPQVKLNFKFSQDSF